MPGAPSERWMLGGGYRTAAVGTTGLPPFTRRSSDLGMGQGSPLRLGARRWAGKGRSPWAPPVRAFLLQEQHPQLQGGPMGENQFNKFQTWAGIRRLSSKNATDPAPPRVAGG